MRSHAPTAIGLKSVDIGSEDHPWPESYYVADLNADIAPLLTQIAERDHTSFIGKPTSCETGRNHPRR